MQTFNELNPKPSGFIPLTMRYARKMSGSELPPIPYEPSSQMSIYRGDITKMMGGKKNKSQSTRSASTKDGWLDIKFDSDWGNDD